MVFVIYLFLAVPVFWGTIFPNILSGTESWFVSVVFVCCYVFENCSQKGISIATLRAAFFINLKSFPATNMKLRLKYFQGERPLPVGLRRRLV